MLLREWKKCFSSDASLVIFACICLLGVGFYWCSANTPYFGDDYYASDYVKLAKEYRQADKSGEAPSEEMAEYEIAGKDVWTEWEEVSDYRTYIEKITQSSFLGLGEETGYQTKLQKEYTLRYKGLEKLTPEFAGNRAIYLFSKSDLGDVILLTGIFFLLFRFITVDRESKAEELLFSAKNGVLPLYRCKWLAGGLLMTGMTVFFYVIKLWMFTKAYAFTDWEGCLQSVPGFLASEWTLSIRQFVILFILGKLWILWLFYSAFYQINYRIYSYQAAFLVDFALCGVSILLDWGIAENSSLADLRLLSGVRLMDVGQLLSGYLPVSLLGQPVSYLLLWLLGGLGLAVFILYRIFFARERERRAVLRRGFFSKTFKKQGIQKKWSCCSTLFSWEWKKWMHFERGIFLVLALAVLVAVTYRQPWERTDTRTAREYRALSMQYRGKVTNRQREEVYQKWEQLKGMEKDLDENGIVYTATAYQLVQEKVEQIPALEQFMTYQNYILQRDGREAVYERGYEMLLGKEVSGGYLRWCSVLGVFFICLLSEKLWGMEKSSGMEELCGITYMGRKGQRRRKAGALALISVFLGMLVYFPWICLTAKAYDMHEWSAAADSLRMLSGVDAVPIGAVIALYYLIHIVYFFVVGMLMRAVRNRVSSSVVSCLSVAAAAVIPFLWFA